MAEKVPEATVRILEGYGHICMIHHDFNLLDYIGSWLDGLSEDPRGEPLESTAGRMSGVR